jgi:hypothetical protein
VRAIVAVHSREVKTALFLALDGLHSATIVATATTTAELSSYCRTFRPDVAIIEHGLPGWTLGETLSRIEPFMGGGRILLIEGAAAEPLGPNARVEVFEDIEDLVEALSESIDEPAS